LVSIKNHQLLVTAMGQAITQVPQLTCLIIGEGALKEALVNQIARMGLEEHVKLTGFLERSDVLAILGASDIFVMTSTYEGTPITLLEAAALGLPIVSTRAGGIPELVNDREHALLVEPGDVQGLAQALAKLSQDRGYALELGCHARQHVQESFSQESQIQLTWQAYRKASEIHKKKPSFLRGGG
jgi:glycosyltransferase involved in cell wall biosynthesis